MEREESYLDVASALAKGRGRMTGYLHLGDTNDGRPLEAPVAVVVGESPGPTLWVNGCIHGDEYLGPAVLARILPYLRPHELQGSFVATPILNPGAFRALRRTNPGDDVDLNRIWAREGLPFATERLKGRVLKDILDPVDCLVDLHSGGNRFLQGAFTVYPGVGGAVEERSADLAKSCGIPLVWAHRGGILEGSLITAAARRGKPAVLVEVAGEGRVEEPWIATMALAIDGVMARLGMLPKASPRLSKYRVFHDFATITCSRGGLWRRRADPGMPVQTGALLGQVLEPLGTVLEEVTCPQGPGEILGICTYGAVASGDYIAEVALGIEEESLPHR